MGFLTGTVSVVGLSFVAGVGSFATGSAGEYCLLLSSEEGSVVITRRIAITDGSQGFFFIPCES